MNGLCTQRGGGTGRPARRGVRSFLRSVEGTTAVEFGILALPFFALVVAIFETCSMLVAQEVLQNATNAAARLIMTGQAQLSSLTAAQFQQAVCSQANALLACSGIYVNVQKFSSFGGVSKLNPVQSGVLNPALMGYNPGGAGDIVLVQTFYQWPIMLGLLGFDLTTTKNGAHLMVGTAVFRNEPYQ